MPKKNRRFRRKSGTADGSESSAVAPPSSDSPSGGRGGYVAADSFLTQPPKPAKGLTGKISTLFRRESSRERLAQHGSSSSRKSPPSAFRTNTRSSDAVLAAISRDEASQMSVGQQSNKRIFYSSHNDDDDDSDADSYESRVSRSHRGGPGAQGDGDTMGDSVSYDDHTGVFTKATTTSGSTLHTMQHGGTGVKMIRRYRGFSTSIKSLFLDESLVCGAVGCFGLILSNRTEYLLQLRNERRGALSPRSFRKGSIDKKKMPSRIVAGGLLLTLLLMFSTFVIWGFGTGNGVAGDYLNGYDYNSNNDNNGDAAAWWDDYLQRDDDAAANNNNDDQQQYDDAYYNNGNNNGDDDANAAADDDDDANNNNQANDDDAANANANDDAAANDDAYNGDDDNNNNRRSRHRREREVQRQQVVVVNHPVHGIFKIRDYQENLWDPILEMLRNDRYREDHAENEQVQINTTTSNRRRRRDEEEGYDDAYTTDDIYDESGSYVGYRKRRDIASDIRIALLFAFLLFLGILGRRRRMRTRFYLVRARAQEDHLYYASSDEAAAMRVAFDDTREDQYEGACSHTLCGCYPADEVDPNGDDENVEVADSGIFRRKKKPYHEDIAARTFNCLMSCCCGAIFKCWFQCLSICALAQEAREVRLLIPPRYQRIDFITHQPFHEYQHAVNDLRRGWLGKARRVAGIMPHYFALSRLSRYIIVLFTLVTATIVATLLFNPRAAFSWQDAVVLMATFVQSFLVLFVVHWIFHKSDLSLDGVIKLFAAGFLIAVPTAFFFEGLLVNIVLFSTWILYDMFVFLIGDGFSSWVFTHWRAIWIIGELFNAYIVAAVTEELCKYYTFRAVEHPDLVFLTGLQREEQADAEEGGIVKYPFSSLQVQELARAQSFGDASQYSNRSSRSGRSERSGRGRSRSRSRARSRSRSAIRSERLIEETGTTETEFDEDENDARTRRQKAMAITTGMISVAVGLACAENFLYVFVLGGAVGENDPEDAHKGDVWEAWIVLFFRSIFPVHALAAAMQSINMIRKFVEFDTDHGHRVGVGRIILPAVIVHGSFDAVLMGINVFVETAWDNYLEENDGNIGDEEPYSAITVNVVAWVSITFIMFAGLLWYYRENRKQRQRLKVLEEQDKALQAQWDGVDSGEFA